MPEAIVKSSSRDYVGKHGEDQQVGLFLKDRTVYEHERERHVQPLYGVLQTTRCAAAKVGVIAKAIGGQTGLGFGIASGIIWANATRVGVSNEVVQFGSTDERLPSGYIPFTVNLPALCVPTISTATGESVLKWYIYAMVESNPQSTVMLSLQRVWVADPVQIKSIAPPANRTQRSHLVLSGALNSSSFYANDLLRVILNFEKPASFQFDGFRLTLKQLLSFNVVDQRNSARSASWSIKKNLGRAEYGDDWYMQTRQSKPKKLFKGQTKIQEELDIVLEKGALTDCFVEPNTALLAPSFTDLSLPVNRQSGKKLTVSLSYYVNVHVILSLSANLIASLPFSIVSTGIIVRDS